MWTQTLRGRLTLWNLAVLSLALLFFGLILNIANQRRLSSEIDNELMNRARQVSHEPPPPPHNRPPGPDPGGPFQEMGDNPPPRTPSDTDPLAYIHRPEVFTSDGTMIRPPGSTTVFDPNLLPIGISGREAFSTVKLSGGDVRVAVTPFLDHGRIVGAIETARELADFQALWHGQTLTLLLLLPMALIVMAGGALFLTNKALRPIGSATTAASEIGEDNLSQRLPVVGQDELAGLSKTFNSMLDRLERAFKELRGTLENQKRFTADASHELRTPLTRLKLATSAALGEPNVSPEVCESLRIADRSADAMARIVNQLLLLSKADAGQLGLRMEPLDVRIAVAEAVDTSTGRVTPIEVDLPEDPVMVMGDEDHLKRAILNLLQNAIRHTPQDKTIRVRTLAEGGRVGVEVLDEGEGISAEHLPHLGERFYRVDEARSRDEGGFGLGLSIVRTVVAEHGGSFEIESVVGHGTTATIWLPDNVAMTPQL
jgi:signal transduction histidine kinase